MSLLDRLPHLASIIRQVRSRDSIGGNVYGVEVEQTGVECWEQPANSHDVVEYEKRGINIDTKIYFVKDPVVTERHRILITQRFDEDTPNQDTSDVANPDMFDVVSKAYPDASAGLGILWRVMCRRCTGATQ